MIHALYSVRYLLSFELLVGQFLGAQTQPAARVSLEAEQNQGTPPDLERDPCVSRDTLTVYVRRSTSTRTCQAKLVCVLDATSTDHQLSTLHRD